jgi:hypothetical protein
MRDEELRGQLARWAHSADLLPVPGVDALRGRVRRRRRARAAGLAGGLALAVSAAVAALAVGALPLGAGQHTTIRPQVGRHGSQQPGHEHRRVPPARTPPRPSDSAGPATAPYFSTIRFQQAPADLLVQDWMTGRTVGTVQPPVLRSAHGSGAAGAAGFIGVAAAGDDRTFALEDAGGANSGRATGFYELRLGRNGQPLPLTQLAVPAATVAHASAFAISPDGRQLAVEVTSGQHTSIEVVSLSSGTARTWRPTRPGQIGSLSWAGNNDLEFDWIAAGSSAGSEQASGLRLLSTAIPGSSLLAAPLIVAQSVGFNGYSGLSDPLVSPDGTAVFVTMSNGSGSNPSAEVVQISLLTGQPVRVVLPPVGESGTGSWCGALWSDPSGQQVTATCGPDEQGTVTDGQLSVRNLHVPLYNESTPRAAFIAW